MGGFRDRVAVVTGAGSGLGLAFAERFAREGMKLALADIDPASLGAAVDGLRARGHQVMGVVSDVARLEDVERLAREATTAFGPIHVLCNNAGVTKHTGEALWDLTDNDWRWLVGVNFWGVVHGIRTFVPLMLAHGEEGHIVNTASLAGLVVGGGAYGVAKHAVVSLSENLLVDLRRRGARIGVTCLCPGLVATNIVDSAGKRPRELMNDAPESAEQLAHRERVAAFTREDGIPPAAVADIVLEGIRSKTFYVFSPNPPTAVNGDECIQRRFEDILARRDPEAIPVRRAKA